jgi:signal transduction histidine kinase
LDITFLKSFFDHFMIEANPNLVHSTNQIVVCSRQAQIIPALAGQSFIKVKAIDEADQLFSYLAEHPCQLLLVDLAICRQASFWDSLTEAAPNMPVLVLADLAERTQAVEQLSYGAADYVLWPAESLELSLKVQHWLEWLSLKSKAKQDLPDQDLWFLHQAAQAMSHTWQVDEIINIVLGRTYHAVGANWAIIYLADRNETLSNPKPVIYPDTLQLQWPTGATPFELISLAQEAALSQKIIHRHQIVAGVNQPEQLGDDKLTVLFVPLISRHKLMGVLGLIRVADEDFSANQVRWLSVFCDQAAIALENTRLFASLATAYIDLAQSREQIQQSHNTLQALFDGITDGLYILDQELIIVTVNQVEAERQGCQPQDLIGQSCLSLGWAQAAPELLQQISQALASGQETTWISPENETSPYLKDQEFRIYPVRNRLAQVEQVIVFGQDVSERRRWQASLFRSANLAAVGQLAGSVAHQINNPLTVTMANSQLLMREADPQGEVYELASSILKAGARIQNIVENLLGFSNQRTYSFEETDLVETIEGALALVARPLQKNRVNLVKDFQAQPVLVGSISHLKLVWMNLLLNARDAVVGYTNQPQIVIATRMDSADKVKVAISDNGVGIESKDFERLFQPFYTTKSVGKALGLGLYAANAIIERHQGHINVSSRPGVGSTFEVVLPLDNPRGLWD